MKDLNALGRQNLELSKLLQSMQEELDYCKLREKKVMYFICRLQDKGYPVDQVFEKEVKPIPTGSFANLNESPVEEGAEDEGP